MENIARAFLSANTPVILEEGKFSFSALFFFFFFLLLSVSVTVFWSSRRWSVRDYKRVVASNFYAKGLACSAFTWGLGIRRRGAETDGLIAWKMG